MWFIRIHESNEDRHYITSIMVWRCYEYACRDYGKIAYINKLGGECWISCILNYVSPPEAEVFYQLNDTSFIVHPGSKRYPLYVTHINLNNNANDKP